MFTLRINLFVVTLFVYCTTCFCAKPANILLLIADDMGYGDVGCYGNHSVRTEQIDSLARDGIKLTQHLTTASTCTPSRAALLTGRHQIRTGMAPTGRIRVNLWPYSTSGLPDSEITYAEITKQAGYANAFFGKWHMGVNKRSYGDNLHHPLNQGFDHFYGIMGTNMGDFGHQSKVVLAQRPYWYYELFAYWAVTASALWCLFKQKFLGAPLFAFLFLFLTVAIGLVFFAFDNFTLLSSYVHRNYDMVEQPIRLAGFSQRLVAEGLEFMEKATDSGKPFLIAMSWIHLHEFIATADEFKGRSQFGRYGDAIEELDWSVGEMLKGLKRFGVEENTLVYFTSDNGGHLEIGTDGGFNGILKGGKAHGAPDGGIRIPGILRWPGVIKPGTVSDEMVSQLDIFPLVATAAGVTLPTDRKYDGKNILPLLKQETDVAPQEFLFHYCGDKLHAVRYRPRTGTTTWKYVTHEPRLLPNSTMCRFVCNCDVAYVLETPKLYDVTSDVGETTPIDSTSRTYRDIQTIVEKAIVEHRQDIDPVDSQFTFMKLYPRLHWQPCCNGVFPFNCQCTDPKFPK